MMRTLTRRMQKLKRIVLIIIQTQQKVILSSTPVSLTRKYMEARIVSASKMLAIEIIVVFRMCGSGSA